MLVCRWPPDDNDAMLPTLDPVLGERAIWSPAWVKANSVENYMWSRSIMGIAAKHKGKVRTRRRSSISSKRLVQRWRQALRKEPGMGQVRKRNLRHWSYKFHNEDHKLNNGQWITECCFPGRDIVVSFMQVRTDQGFLSEAMKMSSYLPVQIFFRLCLLLILCLIFKCWHSLWLLHRASFQPAHSY